MTKIKIIPRYDWVLVKQDEQSNEENGIIIPSNIEEEQKTIGTVISIGKEIVDLKEGDRVVFPTFAGENIEISDDKDSKYKFLKDDDVIAFIKE